jgi:multidrug efflux pump subunit AcrA (membrane-fusion protein)
MTKRSETKNAFELQAEMDAAKKAQAETIPATATTEPGADTTPVDAPDGTPPSGETPASAEDLAQAAADAEAKAEAEAAEANAAAQAADAAAAKAQAEKAEAEEAARAAEEAKAAADAAAAEAEAKAQAEQAEAEMAALRAEVDQERMSALTRIAALITEQNVTGHRPGLISDLQDHWDAVYDTSGGPDTVAIEIYGIKTEPADSMETALTNWANAARREIAQAVG